MPAVRAEPGGVVRRPSARRAQAAPWERRRGAGWHPPPGIVGCGIGCCRPNPSAETSGTTIAAVRTGPCQPLFRGRAADASGASDLRRDRRLARHPAVLAALLSCPHGMGPGAGAQVARRGGPTFSHRARRIPTPRVTPSVRRARTGGEEDGAANGAAPADEPRRGRPTEARDATATGRMPATVAVGARAGRKTAVRTGRPCATAGRPVAGALRADAGCHVARRRCPPARRWRKRARVGSGHASAGGVPARPSAPITPACGPDPCGRPRSRQRALRRKR